LLPPLIAFGVSALLLRLLLLPATRRWLLDWPNVRSLHAAPVPRTGGLAIMPGVALGVVVSGTQSLALGLALGLMLLSVLDDWKGLSPHVRLFAHLAAAFALVLTIGEQGSWLETILLVLGVAWMTNLYNFMDGADGLAGGMAVFGFAAYAAAAWLAGNTDFALACLAVAAAAAAFLLFNFPPARIFMGDAGSIPLGFLAAALGISGWRGQMWPLWFPAVVFSPFVLDASVTLARRLLRGEQIWRAHRSHYYQRQILMGWSHRRLALSAYALMAATATAALCALLVPPAARASILAVLALVYFTLGLRVDLRWRSRQEA
jgi:UDP-N-acetylmuramyl pentapeptide phosphotransferase/UDP-N-acetylglucosamine-1-phosphate transferase